ncbi:MAG: XRE family transcriptional regulator [Bacteriovoracaceae bacterium]
MNETTKKLPDSFFDNDFSFDEEMIEDQAIGVLGPNASAHQVFKYYLCSKIKDELAKRELSNNDAGKLIGVAGSEVSRIMNLRIDRFTIDQLLKFSEKIFERSKLDRGISNFVKAIA